MTGLCEGIPMSTIDTAAAPVITVTLEGHDFNVRLCGNYITAWAGRHDDEPGPIKINTVLTVVGLTATRQSCDQLSSQGYYGSKDHGAWRTYSDAKRHAGYWEDAPDGVTLKVRETYEPALMRWIEANAAEVARGDAWELADTVSRADAALEEMQATIERLRVHRGVILSAGTVNAISDADRYDLTSSRIELGGQASRSRAYARGER